MSVQIGICDDEEIFVNNLKEVLMKQMVDCKAEYEIYTYSNGEDLIRDNNKYKFDIVFLDIEMPVLNGMEVAEKLRDENSCITIIFVTNRDDLVFSSFKYRPFRFIRKQRLDNELEEAMREFLTLLDKDREYYSFNSNQSLIHVKIADIEYFESLKHCIFVHTKNDEFRIKSTLAKLEEEFEIHGFIRVHSGFLVNYRFIYSIGKTDITLTSQKKIPISRHRLENVKRKLQMYARGNLR